MTLPGMNIPLRILAGGLLMSLLLPSCATVPAARGIRPAPGVPVIPQPWRTETRPGEFVFGASTKVMLQGNQPGVLPVAELLREYVGQAAGRDVPIEASAGSQAGSALQPGSVILDLEGAADRLGEEGYLLDVGADMIRLSAAAPAGLFYGVQTVRQLLPALSGSQEGPGALSRLAIPCLSIEDRPRFPWRGALLDSSRHFFPKEFVKRWIDILAMHKLNVFHWHLTDDQGWRIEIKRYPRLTEVGAWRVDREDMPWNARPSQRPGEKATTGGFYSQDEIREIVAYAASRFVTIIPEIEMPGHAKGALTAYPELSCTGGPFTVLPGGYWPITDVFCPGNEATFEFIDNVLSEVVDLFPGKYLHIGGDEVDKAEWKRCPKCQARLKAEGLKDENELQSYFVRRVESILNAKGRSLVGWDEILEGGLAPRATVMSWRGTEGGIAAARAGHDVVMSPTSHCYFDYYQGDPASEPPAIGGFIPLEKAYSFEPVPEVLNGTEARHILGGQANLWTEYIAEGRHAEYMALPRLAALSEAVWSPKEKRNWMGFTSRLPRLLDLYDRAGLNYSRSAFMAAIETRLAGGRGRFTAALKTEIPGLDIRYTTNGTDPTALSSRYSRPIGLKKTTELRAAAFRDGRRMSPAVSSERVVVHAALGHVPRLALPFSQKYTAGGDRGLVDGLLGSRNQDDGRWQGFEGSDLEAVIDLGSPKALRTASARFLQNINGWIFLPVSVEFSVSLDGKDFQDVPGITPGPAPRLAEIAVKAFAASIGGQRVRFLRLKARNFGLLPEWHAGAGGKAWLFVDEIVVQ
jgi:hexosaminidase